MPKCKVCGKSFGSITALRDHHNAVHRGTQFIAPTVSSTRKLTAIIIIAIIVVAAAGGYLAYRQFTDHTGPCPDSQTTTTLGISAPLSSYATPSIGLLAAENLQTQPQIGQNISQQLYQNLTGVSDSTLSSIKNGGTTAPSPVSGCPLTLNGKPAIVYVGGEFCPYCAAERWSMVIAFSRFGTFKNLTYMMSWSNEAAGYQNIATLSFYGANYTSQYISFIGIEEFDQNHNALQAVPSNVQALVNKYDSGGSIPFIDIANNYTVDGSQYGPPTISGLNWSQIGSQLNNPNSVVAKNIDGAANTLISAICKIDGGQPSSVCSQSYAQLSFSLLPDSSSFLMISVYDPLASSYAKQQT
jgi:thiol-disulfide isomerase/thioredoxin